MAEQSTFVKLDRNLLKWRWFKNSKTLAVWIWLIMSANIEDHDFEKETIKRGEVATSRKTIAAATGLTEREVRTALEHLKATGEVSVRIRSKYQVISILEYDRYQTNTSGNRSGSGPAKVRQRSGSGPQLKNIRSKESKKEKNVCAHTPSRDEVAAYAEAHGIVTDVDAFIQYNSAKGWKIGRTKIEDWRPLLLKWSGLDPEAAAPADEPEERGDY